MDTKLFFGTAVFAGQNQVYGAFESSVKCNFGFSTKKIKRTERSCDHKGATAKLIVGLRFLLN
jgi:hypothetical protein